MMRNIILNILLLMWKITEVDGQNLHGVQTPTYILGHEEG